MLPINYRVFFCLINDYLQILFIIASIWDFEEMSEYHLLQIEVFKVLKSYEIIDLSLF